MAWTQADIDTMKAAIASGILTVRHMDGRLVTYQDTADMLRALAAMEQSLTESSTSGRSTFASFRRD